MISVVHPAGLSSETQQTSGSLRLSAIAAMNGIVSPLWAGIFVVEPSGKTGIHHHGEQDTVVYVLEGEACVRWGDSGEYSLTVGGRFSACAELVATSGTQSFEGTSVSMGGCAKYARTDRCQFAWRFLGIY
jgi:uncharacterized RmlC-like cupin family protein